MILLVLLHVTAGNGWAAVSDREQVSAGGVKWETLTNT
jgi:hypothetical protein